MKRILISILLMLSVATQAQVVEYFPKGYFYNGNRDFEANMVVEYMRLAGIDPLWDSTTAKGTVLLRLSLLPDYYHPLFVQVRLADNGGTIAWRRGNAKHYMNRTEGVLDSGRRTLSPSETDTLRSLMAAALPLPRNHSSLCSSTFLLPYLLETVDHKGYSAYYDECYLDPQGRLVEAIIALADSLYLDMEIHRPGRYDSIQPAQFPGGEGALQAFIDSLLVYPPEALRELESRTQTVDFIVERDGTLAEPMNTTYSSGKDYGFSEEAMRVFNLFPLWHPALKDGKPVRSQASVSFRFAVPDSLLPAYGHPMLETRRDSSQWRDIYRWYLRHYLHPDDYHPCYKLASTYFDEAMLPRVPVEPPSRIDTLMLDEFGDSTFSYHFDRTPVVVAAADSALHYYYLFLQRIHAAFDADTLAERPYFGYDDPLRLMLDAYLPIRQLEHHLGLPHNPLNRLPHDTLSGYHYPRSFFCDIAADTLPATYWPFLAFTLSDSYSWTAIFSHMLSDMGEPVLFDSLLVPSDTVLRFAFYPSFHPPLVFRIEHSAQGTMLYWKKHDFTVVELDSVDEDGEAFDVVRHLYEGHRKLSRRQYRRFLRLFETLHFDSLPRVHYLPMLDGAQWVIERRTADTFNAFYTDVAGSNIADLYDYLIKLARIKAKYAREYVH